jgi:VanZ family protein
MKYLAALFALFIVAVIVLADTNQLGFIKSLYDFPNGDKAGHFILYGILSFLLNLAILRSRPSSTSKRVAVSVTLLLALAIGLEEWSQTLVPERTPDWWDLLFSYLGVAVGACAAKKIYTLRGRKHSAIQNNHG